MTETFEGGCSCGEVRYRMTARPMFVHCCHCLDCQRQTGSAFVLNGIIETDHIELQSGKPEPVTMPTDSGRPHDIYRCPKCKIAVWSDYGRRPYVRFVRIGTLDKPSAIQPDVHIFTRSKQPFVKLDGGAPAFDVYYDMAKQWPAESLKRREAVMARA